MRSIDQRGPGDYLPVLGSLFLLCPANRRGCGQGEDNRVDDESLHQRIARRSKFSKSGTGSVTRKLERPETSKPRRLARARHVSREPEGRHFQAGLRSMRILRQPQKSPQARGSAAGRNPVNRRASPMAATSIVATGLESRRAWWYIPRYRNATPPPKAALTRILHQAACRVEECLLISLAFIALFGFLSRYKPSWPRPRWSFARRRAHAPYTIGVAMIPVTSTRLRAKSCAIIAALGAICGLTARPCVQILNRVCHIVRRTWVSG